MKKREDVVYTEESLMEYVDTMIVRAVRDNFRRRGRISPSYHLITSRGEVVVGANFSNILTKALSRDGTRIICGNLELEGLYVYAVILVAEGVCKYEKNENYVEERIVTIMVETRDWTKSMSMEIEGRELVGEWENMTVTSTHLLGILRR